MRPNLKFTLSAVALFAMGCQNRFIQPAGYHPPDRLSDAPLIVDDAMQLRDWDRSAIVYQNGDTPAYPTGFKYETRENQKSYVYPILETPLFVVQTLALPFVIVIQNPYSNVTSTGVQTEPTYNAIPALPPAHMAVAPTPAMVPAPTMEEQPINQEAQPVPNPETTPQAPSVPTSDQPTTQPS